jgi:hypothetical protein
VGPSRNATQFEPIAGPGNQNIWGRHRRVLGSRANGLAKGAAAHRQPSSGGVKLQPRRLRASWLKLAFTIEMSCSVNLDRLMMRKARRGVEMKVPGHCGAEICVNDKKATLAGPKKAYCGLKYGYAGWMKADGQCACNSHLGAHLGTLYGQVTLLTDACMGVERPPAPVRSPPAPAFASFWGRGPICSVVSCKALAIH